VTNAPSSILKNHFTISSHKATNSLHAWFFNNRDVHAIMVKTTPETELLHAAFVEKYFLIN
jgi:hypothetical protein